MSKRITIVLDDDNDKKLRTMQAKEIIKSVKSVSYSRIINNVIRKGLK